MYERVWFWILIVVGLGLAGCITATSVGTAAINKANTTKHTIVYTVTGSGTADVNHDSFENGSSGSASVNGVALPWTKTITSSGLFNVYNVSAILDTGTSVSCKITIDGKQVASQSGSGQFAYVDCTG